MGFHFYSKCRILEFLLSSISAYLLTSLCPFRVLPEVAPSSGTLALDLAARSWTLLFMFIEYWNCEYTALSKCQSLINSSSSDLIIPWRRAVLKCHYKSDRNCWDDEPGRQKLWTTTLCGTRTEFRQFSTKKGSISKALLIKAPATLELLGVSSKLFKYHKLNSWTLLQPALSWWYKMAPYGYWSIPRHVTEFRCCRSQAMQIWNTEIITSLSFVKGGSWQVSPNLKPLFILSQRVTFP